MFLLHFCQHFWENYFVIDEVFILFRKTIWFYAKKITNMICEHNFVTWYQVNEWNLLIKKEKD